MKILKISLYLRIIAAFLLMSTVRRDFVSQVTRLEIAAKSMTKISRTVVVSHRMSEEISNQWPLACDEGARRECYVLIIQTRMSIRRYVAREHSKKGTPLYFSNSSTSHHSQRILLAKGAPPFILRWWQQGIYDWRVRIDEQIFNDDLKFTGIVRRHRFFSRSAVANEWLFSTTIKFSLLGRLTTDLHSHRACWAVHSTIARGIDSPADLYDWQCARHTRWHG